SGGGNFTFPLLGAGAEVTAVDVASGAIRAAIEVAQAEQLPARFRAADLTRGLPPEIASHLQAFEVVVADPPRAGISTPVREALAEARVPRLVYVSCHPSTMARDVAHFAASGYQVERWAMVDMFPRT